jgi:Asp/Glu/hydantoin racemase
VVNPAKSADPSPGIAIVHTSFLAVASFGQLFRELAPGLSVRHVVDDSLLPEVIAEGEVTPAVRKRLLALFQVAEKSGAELIFSQCSSVGEVADAARALVDVPIVKVDEEMAERACDGGRRIGVAATLGSTLLPTRRLIESTAARMNKRVEVTCDLVEGAFGLLESGNTAAHNARVAEALQKLASQVDVVVCAQGSMAAVLSELGDLGVPVLTSPRLGVERALRILRTGAAAHP